MFRSLDGKGLGCCKVWVQEGLGCLKAWVQGSLTGPGIQSLDFDTRVENLGSRKAREYQCFFALWVHWGGLETGWRTLLGNVGVGVERPGWSPPPFSPLPSFYVSDRLGIFRPWSTTR